jgi:hypothetical protein
LIARKTIAGTRFGYHLQTENKDQFLSTDFGLKESILFETRKKTKADQRFGWDVFIEEIGGELIFLKS